MLKQVISQPISNITIIDNLGRHSEQCKKKKQEDVDNLFTEDEVPSRLNV